MKKILFLLVALVCSMSINAQVMKVMKNGEEVATYRGTEYTIVFGEELAAKPYSVTFKKSNFTGFNSSTITASNNDVTIELALSCKRDFVFINPIWSEMEEIMSASTGSKLTITVTPKTSGVTVTGIEYKTWRGQVTKTGEGPWEFSIERDEVYDGSTNLGSSFDDIVVNYTK